MQSFSENQIPDIENSRFQWRALNYHASAPAGRVREWLQDEGSLTRQLVALSNNRFRVEVIAQEWVTLTGLNLLGHFGPVSPIHRFWSRKVVLWGNEQQWVAAHTLVPEHSFLSPLQHVIELGTRPLGEYLFSHTDLMRSEMDFTPAEEFGWGRRSLFFLYQKPVMVAEFFLPTLLNKLAQ